MISLGRIFRSPLTPPAQDGADTLRPDELAALSRYGNNSPNVALAHFLRGESVKEIDFKSWT
jgi:hypothetical protein